MDKFPDRLALLLDKTGTSRRALANALGISERMMQYYLTGNRDPKHEILILIADFFGVSIDYLVGRIDSDSNSPTVPESQKNIDDQLREAIDDPNAMVMFHDFSTATEEEKEMFLEIWNSIKKRGKNK